MLFFREAFERFLEDGLAGPGVSYDEAESTLLAVDFQRVVDFLLVTKQFDFAAGEGILGQAEIGADHGGWSSRGKSRILHPFIAVAMNSLEFGRSRKAARTLASSATDKDSDAHYPDYTVNIRLM